MRRTLQAIIPALLLSVGCGGGGDTPAADLEKNQAAQKAVMENVQKQQKEDPGMKAYMEQQAKKQGKSLPQSGGS